MPQLAPGSRWKGLIGPVLVGLAGFRVLSLLVARYFDAATVESFRLASAVVILLVAGFAVRGFPLRPPFDLASTEVEARSKGGRSVWWWGVCVLAALVLYAPALSVGLLSDDFGHFVRARVWALGPVTPSFFRPLPLALWSLVLAGGGGAVALHALNIVLHGTNAFLTMRLFDGWFPGRRSWAPLAGALFLANPIAPEAVAWASGIFDLSATTAILGLVLVSRGVRDGIAGRLVFFGVLTLALACKETAVVAPVLVLIDAWVRRDLRRALIRDAVIALAICATFSIVRLVHAFGVSAPPLTKYVVQRSIFETFGALASPWHADVVAAWAWMPLFVGFVFVLIAQAVFLHPDVRLRTLGGAAAWILVSVAPVFPIVVVGMDLQGSRYLYLGACAWTVLAAGIAASLRLRPERLLFTVALIVTVAMFGLAARRGLAPWTDAARTRDAVFAAIRRHPAVTTCPAVALKDLPDNVRGAYVLRTDAEAALRVTFGVTLVNDAPPSCTLTWRDGRFN